MMRWVCGALVTMIFLVAFVAPARPDLAETQPQPEPREASATANPDHRLAPRSRRFTFRYHTKLVVPEPARRVRIWIPLPQQNAAQVIHEETVAVQGAQHRQQRDELGNRLLVVDASRGAEEASLAPIDVDLLFDVERREWVRQDFRNRGGTPLNEATRQRLARFLQPNRLVPTDGAIQPLALELSTGDANLLNLARRIYDRVGADMRYDKPEGGAWGRGDAIFACEQGFGNCTDFHSLFLSLSRASGLPARFEMGFSLPPARGEGTIGGYHCWAAFFVPDLGWIPVDISEADKHPDMREYFFGALTEDRVTFTVGRDLVLPGMEAETPVNYLIYPYVEVDGEPYDGTVDRSFSYRDR